MMAVPVMEKSQVAEARRQALAVAVGLGFSEADAGRVALVATELATNLVKYARNGELLVSPFEDPTGSGVEIVSLDKGPGIHNLQESPRDGHSTHGSPGTGLGAVQRQSHVFAIVSWPEIGTAILARLQQGRPKQMATAALWGAVTLPKPGEDVSGDTYCVRADRAGRTILIADGLGHGPQAAHSADEAVRLFHRHETASPGAIIAALHAGLRHTRGAAVSVARLDLARSVVVFAGVGNVASAVIAEGQVRKMVSHNGTVGHHVRRIQEFEYPFTPESLLVMHSDGLASSWSLDRYPGLASTHPTLIAAVLYRDFTRGRDDIAVLAATGAAE
jgi:anti-sigma regulatory factor (Ser/Thr protein kinase)